jgi:hypothetical protein
MHSFPNENIPIGISALTFSQPPSPMIRAKGICLSRAAGPGLEVFLAGS